MSGTPLRLSHISAGYDGVEVLRGLSLVLEPGIVHGLAGPNGSGKTTLLDVVAGLHSPAAGSLTLGGAPLQRADVAYLATELHFYPRITGREYLGVFAASRSQSHPAFDVDGWATVFDIPLDRAVDGYSAGMRRKLGLIGALSLARPVVLLDEPGNTLDLEANFLLGRLLRSIAAQGAIVVVTSHVVEAFATCDCVHRLAGGSIIRSYGPDELPRLAQDLMSGESQGKHALLESLVRASGSGVHDRTNRAS